MKLKFSISVDSELCEWLDSKIASKNFSSRSHGVEYALYQLVKKVQISD